MPLSTHDEMIERLFAFAEVRRNEPRYLTMMAEIRKHVFVALNHSLSSDEVIQIEINIVQDIITNREAVLTQAIDLVYSQRLRDRAYCEQHGREWNYVI